MLLAFSAVTADVPVAVLTVARTLRLDFKTARVWCVCEIAKVDDDVAVDGDDAVDEIGRLNDDDGLADAGCWRDGGGVLGED